MTSLRNQNRGGVGRDTKKGRCSYFAAGSCKKGGQCDYKHVSPSPQPVMNAAIADPTEEAINAIINAIRRQSESSQQTRSQECRDFKQGKCRRVTCKFQHSEQSPGDRELPECWAFQKGSCRRSNCRFKHAQGPRGKRTDWRSESEAQGLTCDYYNRKEGCRFGESCNKRHVCGTCGGVGHTSGQHSEIIPSPVNNAILLEASTDDNKEMNPNQLIATAAGDRRKGRGHPCNNHVGRWLYGCQRPDRQEVGKASQGQGPRYNR